MKLLKIVGVLGTLGMLAGCASDIEQMRTVEATGGNAFTQALTEEYRQITIFEADEMYDWPDAGYFARKGLAAAGGEVVLPEELGNWDLPEDHVQELTDARARLMAALDGGARDSNPDSCRPGSGPIRLLGRAAGRKSSARSHRRLPRRVPRRHGGA